MQVGEIRVEMGKERGGGGGDTDLGVEEGGMRCSGRFRASERRERDREIDRNRLIRAQKDRGEEGGRDGHIKTYVHCRACATRSRAVFFLSGFLVRQLQPGR